MLNLYNCYNTLISMAYNRYNDHRPWLIEYLRERRNREAQKMLGGVK